MHKLKICFAWKINYADYMTLLLSNFIDILLMAIFSISLKAWIGIILWFLLAPVAQKWDIGPIYVSVLLQLLVSSDT